MMQRTLPRQIYWYCRRLLGRFFCHRRYIVFSGPVPAPDRDDQFSFVEHRVFSPGVVAVYERMGRSGDGHEYRLRNRFHHGLSMYECYSADELAGVFWLHPGGRRFIDEVGLLLQLPDGHACLRDVFVMPNFRGRHLFSKMLGELLGKQFQGIKVVWSVSHSTNKSSIRAHRRAGLMPVASIRHVHVANVLLYRSIPSTESGAWSGYQYPRKFVISGRAYREFVHRNLS